MRIVRTDDAALEPGVNGRHGRPATEKAFVRRDHRCQNRGIHVGIPAVVSPAQDDFGPGELEHRGDALAQIALLAADRAAQQALYRDPAAGRDDAGQVRGRLHEPLHRRAHSHDAVRTSVHGTDQPSLRIRIDQRSGQGRFFGRHAHAFVDAPELLAHGPFEIAHGLAERPGFGSRHRHDGPGLARDRIAQPASVDARQAQAECLLGHFEQAEQNEVRIAPLQHDLDAGMAALKPLHLDEESRRGSGYGFFFIGKSHRRIKPSGAAHVQLALGLRVEIDQYVAPQHSAFQPVRADHAGLLGGGDQRLDRTVLDIVRFQHGQYGGHAHAVVSAERRTVGLHPFAVDISFDRIADEIERLVTVLLRNHVHMRLQDDSLAGLHARGRRLAHDHVARRVGLGLDAVRVRLGEQILANRILVMRRTRHAGYLVKLLPHPAGRKLLQILFHNRCLRWALPYFAVPFRPASPRTARTSRSSAPTGLSQTGTGKPESRNGAESVGPVYQNQVKYRKRRAVKGFRDSLPQPALSRADPNERQATPPACPAASDQCRRASILRTLLSMRASTSGASSLTNRSPVIFSYSSM